MKIEIEKSNGCDADVIHTTDARVLAAKLPLPSDTLRSVAIAPSDTLRNVAIAESGFAVELLNHAARIMTEIQSGLRLGILEIGPPSEAPDSPQTAPRSPKIRPESHRD